MIQAFWPVANSGGFVAFVSFTSTRPSQFLFCHIGRRSPYSSPSGRHDDSFLGGRLAVCGWGVFPFPNEFNGVEERRD